MVYFGRVQDGRIVPEPGVTLPDGIRVRFEVLPAAPVEASDELDPIYRMGELAVDDGGPPDLAAEHDHYLYGTPKRRDRKKSDG